MQSLLFTPCEEPSHECTSRETPASQIRFCVKCGVFMGTSPGQPGGLGPGPAAGRVYYRTSQQVGGVSTKIDHERNLENMLRKQHMNRFYNEEASHLVVRPKIVDFMRKIHEKFEKGAEIFHKAAVFMDSVFSRHQVSYDKIEIIVLLCLHIASKFDESFSNYDPDKSFFKYAQKSYSFREIILLEKQLVKILEFQLDVQSPFHFLNFFNSRGLVSHRDILDLVRVYSPDARLPPPSPADTKFTIPQDLQFLTKKIKTRVDGLQFELDGGKNKNINVSFSRKNVLDFLKIFGTTYCFQEKDWCPLSFESKDPAVNENKSPIFDELKKCYLNPLWPLFIELLFQRARTPPDGPQSSIPNLADKNSPFGSFQLKKIAKKFTKLVNAKFEEEERPEAVAEANRPLPMGPANQKPAPLRETEKIKFRTTSFLSTNSNDRANRTSFFTEPILSLPFASHPSIVSFNQDALDKALKPAPVSFQMSHLDLGGFRFTISSNLQTIMRLLNCLRFNREDLPVGLVEVCCSNFENIFELILQGSVEVYSLNKFTSIAVAVSILYISRKLMDFPQVWTDDLTNLTGLSEVDIEGCVQHVLEDKAMLRLVSQMKSSFDFEEQETVFGNKKIISFKNILKMYEMKASKVVKDFRNFEKMVKNQILFKFFLAEVMKEELQTKENIEGPVFEVYGKGITEKSFVNTLNFEEEKENLFA